MHNSESLRVCLTALVRAFRKTRTLAPLWPTSALLLTFSALGTGVGQGQSLVYAQDFDSPTSPQGNVYFGTSANYNGINDGSSQNGVTTGGSFAGNPVTRDGVIGTSYRGITPNSGSYLLGEYTNSGPNYAGTFFSTANVPVLPHSVYQLSFYLGFTPIGTLPQIVPTINGVALSGPIVPVHTNVLEPYSFSYNVGNATNVTLALTNLTATGGGNDFAVDTITFTLVQASFSTVGLTPNQQAIADDLSAGPLNAVSNPVYTILTTNPGAYPAALDQLSPEEFGRFASETVFNDATFEVQAMDDYLASRQDSCGCSFRPGHGLDFSGLNIHSAEGQPILPGLRSRLAVADRASVPDTEPLFGALPSETPTGQRWNVFVRGNVTLAQGFSQRDVGHFDDTTTGVMVGADRLITPHFLAGLKGGYGHTDATLDADQSSATDDGYTGGLYAAYADSGWHANFLGDYTYHSYTQARAVTFLGQTASSAPKGNEGLVDLDGGYDFSGGSWTIGPVSGLQYTRLSLNGYNETGSLADLQVNAQNADSLRSRLGAQAANTWCLGNIVLRPHLAATWQHEFMDQARGITSRFDGEDLPSFTVRTETPQREFALLDAGMTAGVSNTTTVFAEYMTQVGQANYFGQSIQAGVRIQF